MMTRLTLRAALFVLLMLPVTAPCAEQTGVFVSEASLYPFIQYFTWKEFDNSGTRLLRENGPQYGVGGHLGLHLLQGAAGTITLRGRQEFYGGETAYDGHLQNGSPHSTDVSYFGSYSEADLGWAIPYRTTTIEPFAGLSSRWWLRELQGPGGYTEQWTSVASLLGLRCRYELAGNAWFIVSGGVKYPVYTRNLVDYPGSGEVELEPDGDWSVVTEASWVYRQLSAGVYYENFVFNRSPAVRVYNAFEQREILLMQPRSESEIVGLRIGWSFR